MKGQRRRKISVYDDVVYLDTNVINVWQSSYYILLWNLIRNIYATKQY